MTTAISLSNSRSKNSAQDTLEGSGLSLGDDNDEYENIEVFADREMLNYRTASDDSNIQQNKQDIEISPPWPRGSSRVEELLLVPRSWPR